MQAVGMVRTIRQQAQANHRASLVYATGLIVLLGGLGAVIAGYQAPDYWWVGSIGAGLVGFIVAIVALTKGDSLVLKMSGVRDPAGLEGKILDNVAEEMAIAAGIPKPRVYVLDDSAPNAFATGLSPRTASVVFTTGIIEKLDRDELQGVMAHEIAHIRNDDCRFMTTLAIVAGLIPLMADMVWHMIRFSRGGRDKDQSTIVFLVIGIVLALLAPIMSVILQMAVSRKREYLADATAAELTRYPEGLARALEKIAKDPEPLEAANRATQHMYIINPLQRRNLSALFSTHPPTDDRIRALRQLAGNYRRETP